LKYDALPAFNGGHAVAPGAAATKRRNFCFHPPYTVTRRGEEADELLKDAEEAFWRLEKLPVPLPRAAQASDSLRGNIRVSLFRKFPSFLAFHSLAENIRHSLIVPLACVFRGHRPFLLSRVLPHISASLSSDPHS
jgi:hypothetical protein